MNKAISLRGEMRKTKEIVANGEAFRAANTRAMWSSSILRSTFS